MGVFEKIKNALFEEEYVEVEEKPKKPKKNKIKEKKDVVVEKPIAKKVILPEKKETKVEKIEEENYEEENKLESETISLEKHSEFKIMDDNDFKVDDEEKYEPKIVEVIDKRDYNKPSREDFMEYGSHSPKKEKLPYGINESAKVKIHEYGGYEKKEEKTFFKPSPIISPIYGVLDKNYKKEDVVAKKDVRLSSSFSRGRMNVDEVRNKAYGTLADDIAKEIEDNKTTFDVMEDKEEQEENKLVDLSGDSSKPTVKEVTMGDALEYFQDLGLEYNVDYVDASKEKPTRRRVKEDYEDFADKNKKSEKKEENINKSEVIEDKKNMKSEESKENMMDFDSDDNLFDLIDSMYQENE